MTKITFKLLFPILPICLIFLCISVFWGCADFKKEQVKKTKIPSQTHEWKTLINGYEAFKQGKYENAAHIFGYLHEPEGKGRINRLALYGLACSRLIAADNGQELNEAFKLWDQWAESFSPDPGTEDPNMLKPVLNELKASVQKKENKIQSLSEKLKGMQQEINWLKHQINELEAIDQKIEKKKKEISSPQ
jgi:predicted RNase H-like nuclease (RuvC/YqgF family)